MVGKPDARQDRSLLGFDAQAIVNGSPNSLLAAEVPLGRLNGDVPEEELNLLEFAARRMAQPSTRSPEIVRREPLNTRFTGVLANEMPDCLFRQTVTPSLPVLVYPPKQLAGGQVGSLKPTHPAKP